MYVTDIQAGTELCDVR